MGKKLIENQMIFTEWVCQPEILLCENIPQPLHGVAPRVVLGQKWWDQERKAAYRSTQFHCLACGVSKHQAKYHKWLEGHEIYDIDYAKGRSIYIRTVPLCHFCHNYIHDGRLTALLQQCKIHQGKYVQIVQHGNRVLSKAGLERATLRQRGKELERKHRKGEIAEWSDWRMVVNGEEYTPLYSSPEELNAANLIK